MIQIVPCTNPLARDDRRPWWRYDVVAPRGSAVGGYVPGTRDAAVTAANAALQRLHHLERTGLEVITSPVLLNTGD